MNTKKCKVDKRLFFLPASKHVNLLERDLYAYSPSKQCIDSCVGLFCFLDKTWSFTWTGDKITSVFRP